MVDPGPALPRSIRDVTTQPYPAEPHSPSKGSLGRLCTVCAQQEGLGGGTTTDKRQRRDCPKGSKHECRHHCVSTNLAPASGLSWGNGSARLKSSFLCFQMGPPCSHKYMDFVLIISSQGRESTRAEENSGPQRLQQAVPSQRGVCKHFSPCAL